MCNRLILIFICISINYNIYGQFSIELQSFATGLNLPVDIACNGSGHLFIAEKNGVIRVVDPAGQVLQDAFLDIRNRVNATRSEEGLLGLAFHPDFESNGEFYVNYTDFRDLTVISRFKVFPGEPFRADPDSEEQILKFSQPFNNHNGGDLAFGPDGFLYIASGDGGSANDPFNNGQTGTTMLGKILRIDVNDTTRYRIPADNPFIGNAGFLDEIWALGLRNPWRISFDRLTGDFWMGDVGQDTWEEINFQPANSSGGHNYGWRCYEGNHEFMTGSCQPASNYDFPIFEYNNNKTQAGCSITGGYVYRGSDHPEMQGWYLYSDYCSGKFWALWPEDTTNISVGDFGSNQFATFGEDDDGELYAAAIQAGIIYKVGVVCELTYNLSKMDQQCPNQADGSLHIEITSPDTEASITWSTGDTTERVFNLFPRWYYVNIKAGSCDITDSIEILRSDLAESCLVDTFTQIAYCQGDTAILEACQGEPGYEYEWYVFDAILKRTADPFLEVTESGVYSMSLKGDCNLGVSREVQVIFHPAPERANINRDADTLLTDVTADTYRWYLNDTFLTETTEAFLTVMVSGDYQVAGVNGGLCEGERSDVITVVVTATHESGPGEFSLFPNPFTHEINLIFSEPKVGSLRVHGANGKTLLTQDLRESQVIDMSPFPSGIYFLEVRTDATSKIMYLQKIAD